MTVDLRLTPADSPPADLLLPPFVAALRAGGPSAWYLAPDGATADIRVRQVAREAPIMNAPIGTLGDLAESALRKADLDMPELPEPRLLEMMADHAISRVMPDAARGPGLARALVNAVESLLQDGWTPDTFAAALQAHPGSGRSGRRLLDLWTELASVCPEIDTAAGYRLVLEKKLLGTVAPDLLFIEGGGLRGELQARMLQDLVHAVREGGGSVHGVYRDLPTDVGRHTRAADVIRNITGVERISPSSPRPQARDDDVAAAIRHVVRHLFRSERVRGPEAPAGVWELSAPDAYGTADLVAREIRGLLRNSGEPEQLLERGVAVVVPTSEDREFADRALRKWEIPVSTPTRETMSDQPGGRHILRVLEVLAGGGRGPIDPVLELLTGDAWGIGAEEADRIARLIYLAGAARARDVLSLSRLKESEAGRDVRRRLGALLELADELRGAPPAEFGQRLRLALGPDGSGDPRRGAWMRHGMQAAFDGHRPTAAVRGASGHARPFRMLDDLLVVLEARIRRTGWRPGFAEWARTLRTLLEATPLQVGSSPALGVRIESARPQPGRPGALEPAEVVFVIGLTERRFPRRPRQQPFLPDALREDLATGSLLGARISSDEADEERENFVLSCAAARRRLYLCTPRFTDDGREALPSFFIEDVARVLGGGEVAELPQVHRRAGEVVPEPDRAASTAELHASIAAALQDPELPEERREVVAKTYGSLLEQSPDFSRTVLGDFPTWRARITGEEERRELAERAGRLSASQLSKYGHCGYRHFVESRLRPEVLEMPVFDALRRGGLAHDWLFRFGARLDGWADPEAALARLGESGVPTRPPSAFAPSSARHEWQRALSETRAFLQAECERLTVSDFTPQYHELAFGYVRDKSDPRSLPEPVELELNGERIAFAGSIDRVDTWTDSEGVTWGLAIDYKSGKVDRYSGDLDSGEEIQIPLYLRMLEQAFGIRPAGALYASVRERNFAGIVHFAYAPRMGPLPGHVRTADDDGLRQLRERSDAEIVERYHAMREPEIEARPRDWDCGYCELKSLCRIDLWRARSEAAQP